MIWGGAFLNEYGEYQHGGWCSGSPYHPRRPGNTCSCYRFDLWYRRLGLGFNREAGSTRRTLWVATCSGCGDRQEFPFTDAPIPRERYCQTCCVWVQVKEESWEGNDFSQLLPVLPRRSVNR